MKLPGQSRTMQTSAALSTLTNEEKEERYRPWTESHLERVTVILHATENWTGLVVEAGLQYYLQLQEHKQNASPYNSPNQ